MEEEESLPKTEGGAGERGQITNIHNSLTAVKHAEVKGKIFWTFVVFLSIANPEVEKKDKAADDKVRE